MPHITKGTIKALAVAGPQKLTYLPSVPTMGESGYSGFDSPTWFGVIAPTGTPKEIISLLNLETKKALSTPSIKTRLDQAGVETQYMTTDQFASFMQDEISRWENIVRSSDLKIN
jgi:tripartite-type tricarboxylate transporter receptor subunit TctC